jgi:pyruvate formate lyase activating enzyme
MNKQKPEQSLEDEKALIFKVDRFATHDGPGIRTTVFFKGCAMRCKWCSNPESQKVIPELGLLKSKCISCGYCIDICPHKALHFHEEIIEVDFDKCDNCLVCTGVCPTKALYAYGYEVSVSDLMHILSRDRHIYQESGGGVTCTGGEPFLQHSFLQKFLKSCKKSGINTVVESSGNVNLHAYESVLPYVDWLYFDLKHSDSAKHIEATGCNNDLIHKNLFYASKFMEKNKKTLIIRQVVVPGINDDKWIEGMIDLVKKLPYVTALEFLPYHNYGMDKYSSLGMQYELKDVLPVKDEMLNKYKKMAEDQGLKCSIGRL